MGEFVRRNGGVDLRLRGRHLLDAHRFAGVRLLAGVHATMLAQRAIRRE